MDARLATGNAVARLLQRGGCFPLDVGDLLIFRQALRGGFDVVFDGGV